MLIALLSFLLLVLICLYIFIPRHLYISSSIGIDCSAAGAERTLLSEKKWEQWWPGTFEKPYFLLYKNDKYKIEEKFSDGVSMSMLTQSMNINSKINIVKLNVDSTKIEWNLAIDNGLNPFVRISNYLLAKKIKTNLDFLVGKFGSFLANRDNIYDISISKSLAPDSLLISTKTILNNYPSTSEVYDLIATLKKYATANNATVNGNPMMNVTLLDKQQFQLMVALPIDKALKGSENIFARKMVHGNFLVATVKGGISTVNEALNQMQLYFQDYDKTSMAIPFQYIITDRITEPDTTKWITKIYAPVYK